MKYLESHPWISFAINVNTSDFRFWLQIGEVASKCEHLSGVPLSPEVAEDLNSIFLAKGVLATTAIEGNTLSEEQVRKKVDGKLELPPSQEYLGKEVENIIDLCNEEVRMQMDSAQEGRNLCKQLIKKYNEKILRDLEVEDGVIPGKLRTHSVVVGNVYRGAPPENCEYLLDKLCEWLNGTDFDAPEDDLKIPFAIIKAIVAHVYLAWIHAFGDGNGRTARLVEFHILFSSGVPLPAAHLLSDHYNHTRSRYYRELDKASRSGGDLMPFVKYALQGFLDGMRSQIRDVRFHQMQVTWENYVHSKFREKNSPTQKRRRDLVLELSNHSWVPVSKVESLSPKIAKAYATAGNRMVQRDLNAVFQMGLIHRRHGEVLARKYLIEAFLPARVQIGQDSK